MDLYVVQTDEGDFPALVLVRAGTVARCVVYFYGSPPVALAVWCEVRRLRAPTDDERRQMAYLHGSSVRSRFVRLWLERGGGAAGLAASSRSI